MTHPPEAPNSDPSLKISQEGMLDRPTLPGTQGNGAHSTDGTGGCPPIVETAESSPKSSFTRRGRLPPSFTWESSAVARGAMLALVGAIVILLIGIILNFTWLILAGSLVALVISLRLMAPTFQPILANLLTGENRPFLLGFLGFLGAILGLLKLTGLDRAFQTWISQLNWDAVGALGEVFGALGQILIAVLAVYIAWRQYVIEKDLTLQQNLITQQQTIDSYFQGISDLVLDEEGLLEDWPQERAIAEGRTAAILSSVDAEGKAKVIRFLSRANLLSPLRRDNRLGRAILDGTGGYQEDRAYGLRVIDLGVMLAGASLANTDLRWTDLSEANLIRANLSHCDLVRTNLSRAILYEATLKEADLQSARFFYGQLEKASPRSRTEPPDYKTGVHTGAVVENADLTDAHNLSEEQRYYFCAWGGSKTRGTVPGGCDGIPNKLGR